MSPTLMAGPATKTQDYVFKEPSLLTWFGNPEDITGINEYKQMAAESVSGRNNPPEVSITSCLNLKMVVTITGNTE